MAFQVITPPVEEPISLAEARAHLRLDDGVEDSIVNALIAFAREATEKHLRRALVTQTLREYIDEWPNRNHRLRGRGVLLPRCPVQSIVHVKYVASDGTLTTIAEGEYELDNVEEPNGVYPAYGLSWPTPRAKINAIQIEFVAGYGAAEDVPEGIKRAMLPLLAFMFENREAVITGTIASELPIDVIRLLAPYRVYRFH